jgi:hypothetical protein
MSQIMRLRRLAGSDHRIEDRNNGHRHEFAFSNNIVRNGLLHEADLLGDSYGGKLHPRAISVLLASLPVILRALVRRTTAVEMSTGVVASIPSGAPLILPSICRYETPRPTRAVSVISTRRLRIRWWSGTVRAIRPRRAAAPA